MDRREVACPQDRCRRGAKTCDGNCWLSILWTARGSGPGGFGQVTRLAESRGPSTSRTLRTPTQGTLSIWLPMTLFHANIVRLSLMHFSIMPPGVKWSPCFTLCARSESFWPHVTRTRTCCHGLECQQCEGPPVQGEVGRREELALVQRLQRGQEGRQRKVKRLLWLQPEWDHYLHLPGGCVHAHHLSATFPGRHRDLHEVTEGGG